MLTGYLIQGSNAMTTPQTSSSDCVMCDLPVFQRGGSDPRQIADLEVSTAVLASKEQFYRGYTLLVLNHHAVELFDLDHAIRQQFVEDANHMAEALNKTFQPLKMNLCLLRNTLRHIHWHLIPRRETDPDPKWPVWKFPFPDVQLSDEEFQQMAHDIRSNL